MSDTLSRLVMIEWVDSSQPEPAWKHFDDFPELRIISCISVGWLVGKTDAIVMLAPNVADMDTENNAQASGFIRIPAASITRTVDLVQVTVREVK